jgi:hypothetical protein
MAIFNSYVSHYQRVKPQVMFVTNVPRIIVLLYASTSFSDSKELH